MDKEILKELGIEGEIDSLTVEQITEHRSKVIEAAKKAIEAKDVAKAEKLANFADTLKARKETLDKETAEREAKLTELAARFEEPKEEPKEEVKLEVKAEEPAKVETPKVEAKAEAPAEPAKAEAMPVAASGATVNIDSVTLNGTTFTKNAPMPKAPASNTPTAPKTIVASITAASATNDLTAGAPITDIKVLASMTANQAQVLVGNPGMTGKFPVANLHVEYSKERSLGRDAEESTQKIEALTAAAVEETKENLRRLSRAKLDDILDGSITADGGLCAPLNVSYDVFQIGTENRPIRDGLVRFGATRGGIRFMTSPTLADVAGSGGGASVLVITEEQDAAGATDKPCLVLTCGEEVEEKVDAVTKCVQIGNWSYLSYRERFDAQWRLVGVHHAREAEINLWNRLVANSTALTGTTPVLGISRDVTNQLVRRAAKKRSLHRVAKNTPVRVIAPDILFEMFAEDRRNQLPGDSAVATAEAEFRRELAMHNIALTLSPDIEIAGVQAEGELDAWPTSLEFLMFFEGTHLFLDMGRLDFGLFRDSVLNTSNNLRVMEETFEGIATPGFESDHITLDVCATGATSGTVDVPCVLS
jgi:chemotaxis protein histidine kinase CheA